MQVDLTTAGIPHLHRPIPNSQVQWLWCLGKSFLVLLESPLRVWRYANVQDWYTGGSNAVHVPIPPVVRVRLNESPFVLLDACNPHYATPRVQQKGIIRLCAKTLDSWLARVVQ